MNSKHKQVNQSIKCVVWDLDNTLWTGILLENDNVSIRNEVVNIIKTLDSRGILQSIASKNDYNAAMEKLQFFGLKEYFLYPQIGWSSKVSFVTAIAKAINIGIDAIAFVDDDPFEREEVAFSLPEVLCIDAANLEHVLDMPQMIPRFITEDSKLRRKMYLSDMVRNKAEEKFVGPKEGFLASLNMELTIFKPEEKDLKRAEELTVRTNQLNATGYTYSYDELDSFRKSKQHKLLMAKLVDKCGSYGHIGLALIECDPTAWTINLLLMSCRVMSRGVGTIMLNHIMNLAKIRNVRLLAKFVPNGRNRMMNITYGFSGFREIEHKDNVTILENTLKEFQAFPNYIKVKINE